MRYQHHRATNMAWLVPIALGVVVRIAWSVNIIMFTECDFRPDYKCEVLHGLGIIPMFAPLTIWFGVD